MSQLLGGLYDELTFSAVALGVLGVALGLALSGLVPRPPIALWAPLVGLWLWSLISSVWSESAEASRTAADRWLLYAGAVGVLGWILRGERRRAITLLTGVAAGVFAVALWLLAQMLAGHGPDLFLGARLNGPLGYGTGQACYLLLATWPSLALAERRGSRVAPSLAGLGMCALVALTGVGLMAQSRSWAVALAGASVVTLAILPGRRRRGVAMIVAAAAVAAIFSPLSRVWRHPSRITSVPTAATTEHAAALILIAAVSAGCTWAIAVLVVDRLAPSGTRARSMAGRLVGAVLGAVLLAAVGLILANAGSISHRIRTQYSAFVHLARASHSNNRLLSGAGNRYDYWRVALIEFRSAPIGGVGAGDYEPGYYVHRHTTEAIQQPHSIEFQTLAELGVVGALLLGAYLVAVIVGIVRTARDATHDELARTIGVAAAGAFTAWWIQTSVDWMHLIPGLTAIALASSLALVARGGSLERARSARARLLAAGLAIAVTVAGVVTLVPRIISLQSQSSAERALGRRAPRLAIHDATIALQYDPDAVSGYELRAAGFARLHDFSDAYADLKRALRVEPRNWTTWALLGDLLTRHGDRAGAHAAYARAHALNPSDEDIPVQG